MRDEAAIYWGSIAAFVLAATGLALLLRCV